MAKEIKVTFENGGVYEGFANTYTLDNSITYYFSFDRDYRVQMTGNVISLQEYRNAGAWYPIDIITNFEIAEIGATDVTKQWVQDNFVKKSGDTMTGTLKFDFGGGVVFRIESSSTTSRVKVTGNGSLNWENDNKKRTFSIVCGEDIATLNFYNVDNKRSNICFRDYEYGSSGIYRLISYSGFFNNDTNNPWTLSGKFKTFNDWFFNGETYFDSYSYWRSHNVVNFQISNNGDMFLYNAKQLYIRKNAKGATNDHFTTFKYNGQDTISNISGEDATYKITGYNKFNNSTEFYNNIAIKTENQSTGTLTLLTKTGMQIQDAGDPNNNDRTIINRTQIFQYNGNKMQFSIVNGRIDIFNDSHLFLHSGSAGTTETYSEYKHDGIYRANYAIGKGPFNINGGSGPVYLSSSAKGTALRLNTNSGDYSLTSTYGTVTGAGLYTTCNDTYYSESFLNALNACLGYIFDNIGKDYYVQFVGTTYHTGGGKTRGGGVGRKKR